MLTPAQFRSLLPEFACTSTYPDMQIEFWLGLAGVMLNADRWGETLDYGTALFVAHHLTFGERDEQASSAGGIPGTVNGPQTAKAVDKVSASYDTNAVTLDNAGFWNGTTYGIRFMQLARWAGSGGIQI